MNRMPNGKVEFERLEQTHISIDNRSANVHTVNNAIKMKWGSDFVVVTGDGLEVDDSSGTQGNVYICGIIYLLESQLSNVVVGVSQQVVMPAGI